MMSLAWEREKKFPKKNLWIIDVSPYKLHRKIKHIT